MFSGVPGFILARAGGYIALSTAGWRLGIRLFLSARLGGDTVSFGIGASMGLILHVLSGATGGY